MGCGLTSRYMVDRRRQRVVTTSDLRGGVVKPPVPRMWDVRTVPGKESWKELTVGFKLKSISKQLLNRYSGSSPYQ